MSYIARCLALASVLFAPAALAQTISTYQGRLNDRGAPFNGTVDVHVELFDAATGGMPLAVLASATDVLVADGLLQVDLDVPRADRVGDARYLEISLRRRGEASYTTLSPRQILRPAPEAGDSPGARVESDGAILIRPDVPEQGPAVDIISLSSGSTEQVFSAGVRQEFVSLSSGEVLGLELGLRRLANTSVLVRLRDAMQNELGIAALQQSPDSERVTFIGFDPGIRLGAGERYSLEILGIGQIGFAPVGVDITDEADPYPDGDATEASGASVVGDVAVRVLLETSTPQVLVDTAASDDPVELPASSVQADEIEAEAGIAFSERLDSIIVSEVPSLTMRAPGDGVYLVIASGRVRAPQNTNLTLGLATASETGPNDFEIWLRAIQSGGNRDVPLYLQGIYPVTAGQELTVFFTEQGGFLASDVNDFQLTGLFFPTDYTVHLNP